MRLVTNHVRPQPPPAFIPSALEGTGGNLCVVKVICASSIRYTLLRATLTPLPCPNESPAPLCTSYAHLFAIKDSLLGVSAPWVPSGVSRYLFCGISTHDMIHFFTAAQGIQLEIHK